MQSASDAEGGCHVTGWTGWTESLQDLAKELWDLSLEPGVAERRRVAVSSIFQARAVLQAANETKKLVKATWSLVGVTAVLALAAAIVGAGG